MNENEVLAKVIGEVFENDSRAWSESMAGNIIDRLFEAGFYLVPTDWGNEMFRLVHEVEAALHTKLEEQFVDPV